MPALKNTKDTFGFVARSFHWGMAFIILGLLCMGFWMHSLEFSPFKLQLYGLHKSFGLLILFLAVLRIGWRMVSKPPVPHENHPVYERFLAQTIHIVFYISFVGMPLSGWLMSSAGEYAVSFFGLYEMPDLISKNEGFYELMKVVHEMFAWLLTASIGLHIAGAIKHKIIDHDDTMRRMGANSVLAISGLLILLIPATFIAGEIYEDMGRRELHHVQTADEPVQENASASPETFNVSDDVSDVQKWIIDPQSSSINFEFGLYGENVSGNFESWGGDIYFDPDNLAESHARIEIDINSIKTGSADRDEQAIGPEWFAASQYSKAVFETESFEAAQDANEANQYVVDGHLTLRGAKLPVSFPFSLQIQSDENGQTKALMSGDLTLDRTRFGIGQGQWESGESVAKSVKINLRVVAVSVPRPD